MTVGEKIKKYREHKGLSQKQFAARINKQGYSFGQTALSNVEVGYRKPTQEFIDAFKQAFPNANTKRILTEN